jgi:spermidine/putrescine-binding protein
MKTKIEFFQEGTNYSFDAEVKNSVNNFVGTACNQMFRYVTIAKAVNAKTFDFKEPINLRVTAKGVRYDTSTCDQALQAKLKLQRSDKGMVNFAKRVFELVKWSTTEVQDVTMAELLESFE